MSERQKGFTLIELVIVIVILGILGVTTAPLFLNLSTDAKNSALNAAYGAIQNSIDLSHSKLVIAGLQDKSQVLGDHEPLINSWCPDCEFSYGYPNHKPDATWNSILTGTGTDGDFAVIRQKLNGESMRSTLFVFKDDLIGGKYERDNCYIKWTLAGKKSDGTFQEAKLELIPCTS